LPLVRHVKDFSRRSETLDHAVNKYNMNINRVLADYLDGLLPILQEQRDSVKQLDDYLCPPTVELFHKKAEGLLKNAPPHVLPASKRNTCAICMEAEANCVISRCCTAPTARSHPHCEQDTCKCGPTMCRQCLLTHYWTSTNKGSKSYAKCVCCRAEFCMKDIFSVQYEEEKPPATTVAPSAEESVGTTPKENSQEIKYKKEKPKKEKPRTRTTTAMDKDSTVTSAQEKGRKRESPERETDNDIRRSKRRKATGDTTTTTQVNNNNNNDEGRDRDKDPQERYSLRSSSRNAKH